MNPERYRSILSDIGDQAFIVWYFSTGEPLLHKHFADLVSTSKNQEIFSAISTNLSLPLSDKRIEDLILSGLRMIMVSLDGATEETYSRYRIGGKFDLVLENIRRLVKRKRELGLEFPLIEWRFLRFRHNQHEEDVARKMAISLGVDLLEFFSGYAPDTAADNEVQLANLPLKGPPVEGPALTKALNRRRGLLDQLLADEPFLFGLPRVKTDVRKCDWLYFGTMIYPDGAVGSCCVASDKKDDFCNLDDYPAFHETWNAPKFTKSRELFSFNIMSRTICDRCPFPDSQTYQFGQKLRGILRIAPPWVLKVLDAAPEKFFFDIDRLLMPQEVGAIFSGRLGERFPELRSDRLAMPSLHGINVAHPLETLLNSQPRSRKQKMLQRIGFLRSQRGPSAAKPEFAVDRWLAGLDQADGIHLVSPPRPFFHDEAAFDAGLRLHKSLEAIGAGLITQLHKEGCDFTLPALEIGCGGGALSIGLARHGTFPRLVLSDPSPAFLAILRRRLAEQGIDTPALRYALMAAEEIDQLPAEGFGLIALRHTVHHILDVEGFLKRAATALRPGGFLAFEEPCAEALILMAALCKLLPGTATAESLNPTPQQLEQNDLFCRTIEFYARRDIDKSQAEDKHVFRTDEMIETGRRAGFEVRAFPNRAFDFWNQPEEEQRVAPDYFSRSFRGYLEHVIGFGSAFGELWEKTLGEAAAFVDRCASGGTGPYYLTTFLCRKL